MHTIGKAVCVIGMIFFLSCIVAMPVICRYATIHSPTWLSRDVIDRDSYYDWERRKIVYKEEKVDRISPAINFSCVMAGVLCGALAGLCGYSIVRALKAG